MKSELTERLLAITAGVLVAAVVTGAVMLAGGADVDLDRLDVDAGGPVTEQAVPETPEPTPTPTPDPTPDPTPTPTPTARPTPTATPEPTPPPLDGVECTQTMTINALSPAPPFPAFQNPLGVVGDAEGNIYVADATTNVVHVFDASGSPIRRIDSASPAFFGITALAVDDAGNLYVVSSANATVHVFDPLGNQLLTIGAVDGDPVMNNPRGIDVDAEGNIYVADEGNGTIHIFDPTGTQIGRINRFATPAPELTFPRDVAVDDEGTMYIAPGSGLIVGYTPSGERVLAIPGDDVDEPRPAFRTPGQVTLDGAGRLWVADGTAQAITAFGPDGTQIFRLDETLPLPPDPQFGNPLAVGSDGGEMIYVLDNIGRGDAGPTLWAFRCVDAGES